MQPVNCGNCRFYVHTMQAGVGECHEAPGSVIVIPQAPKASLMGADVMSFEVHGVWFPTKPANWCGKWEAIPDAPISQA